MKKVLFAFLLVVASSAFATDKSFNATMVLLTPIVINKTADLVFPATVSGAAADVTVATGDAGAAVFNATGEASTGFTKSVVEASIEMTTDNGVGSTKRITVDTFTLAGPAAFDAGGAAAGLKVGGTAHVQAEDIAGSYSGAATYRIVY
jgi:hypothetical protein